MNKTSKRFKSTLLIVLAVMLVSVSFTGCGNATEESDISYMLYVVTVESKGGMPLKGIGVFVYKDAELTDLAYAAETDINGKISFDAEMSQGLYAVLKNVPNGYSANNVYPLDESKTIKLESKPYDNDSLFNTSYTSGSIMHDFSVVDYNGNEHKLSELLKTKKAVVLNFWFIGCGPCKMEFPYMQEAYMDYKNDIEIIALNPIDGTNEEIKMYASNLGLTFPMLSCDKAWTTAMRLTAFPTTVVIDRYGMVSLIHLGSITDKETFTKIFDYYISDDYKQSNVKLSNILNK